MYGALCKRGFALIFCENGNALSVKNFTDPGSCKKTWASQFEKCEFKYYIDFWLYSASIFCRTNKLQICKQIIVDLIFQLFEY